MGKRMILFMTCLFSCAVLPLAVRAQALEEAEDNAAPVESRVARVLMYSDRALVLRTGETTVPAGRSRVVFEGLPERMADDSVTASIGVNGATTALAKIANIEVERVYETTFRDDEKRCTSSTAARNVREAIRPTLGMVLSRAVRESRRSH